MGCSRCNARYRSQSALSVCWRGCCIWWKGNADSPEGGGGGGSCKAFRSADTCHGILLRLQDAGQAATEQPSNPIRFPIEKQRYNVAGTLTSPLRESGLRRKHLIHADMHYRHTVYEWWDCGQRGIRSSGVCKITGKASQFKSTGRITSHLHGYGRLTVHPVRGAEPYTAYMSTQALLSLRHCHYDLEMSHFYFPRLTLTGRSIRERTLFGLISGPHPSF